MGLELYLCITHSDLQVFYGTLRVKKKKNLLFYLSTLYYYFTTTADSWRAKQTKKHFTGIGEHPQCLPHTCNYSFIKTHVLSQTNRFLLLQKHCFSDLLPPPSPKTEPVGRWMSDKYGTRNMRREKVYIVSERYENERNLFPKLSSWLFNSIRSLQ